MKIKNSTLKVIQKNYSWIIAVSTSLAVILAFILKFTKYIYSQIRFNYYGIAYEMYDKNELNYLYDFYLSIIILLCFGSLLYCYIQLLNLKGKKDNNKIRKDNISLIIISNVIIALSISNDNSLIYTIISVIILIVVELIIAVIFNSLDKRDSKKTNQSNNLLDTLKLFPFYIILYLVMLSINYLLSFIGNKSYRIIDNDKVIVYSTKEYSIALNCVIDPETDELIIYKGEYTMIDTKNTFNTTKKFKEVKLK